MEFKIEINSAENVFVMSLKSFTLTGWLATFNELEFGVLQTLTTPHLKYHVFISAERMCIECTV